MQRFRMGNTEQFRPTLTVWVVSVPCLGGYNHRGIASETFGIDENGQPLVAHNPKGRHGMITSLAEFCQGQQPMFEPRYLTRAEFELMVTRVRRKLDTPYDLLSWNCEHFVNYALTGKPESPQLGTASWLTVFGVLIYVATKRKSR